MNQLKLKKLSLESKMKVVGGGVTFSVILGIVGFIQTISLLVSMIVDLAKPPVKTETEILETPYQVKPNVVNKPKVQKDQLPRYLRYQNLEDQSRNIVLS
ncbi:hypothetical protein MCAV_02580 [[Mycoplasma] cavipharyngis]|uniref:hypothetical protein n=1 Tax=[Mycoplasma] cavipharyngis TaxID=92757 RepID=UPI0037043FDB